MPSKRKSTVTKEEAKPTLVPKLRFPEFRGAAVRIVQLGDITEECRNRNGNKHSAASVMGVTKADGIVPMEARLIAPDITRYKLVQKDWFAYNPMRLNIGSIARWKGESEILVSPDYVVFNCISDDESGVVPGYLDQFRQTKAWEAFVTEGGDGSVRVRIYYKDIARVALALPSPPEQQKIAECLGSVDELIAAQARKVDALKTHKKWLMQQLFPREGDTQPRLRFPEFHNAGEWVKDSLGNIFETTSGGTPSRTEKTYWNGDIPWITTSLVDFRVINSAEEFITAEGLKNSSAKLFPKGTVLMALYGQGKTRGQVALLGIQAATNQACAAILPRKDIDPYFLFLYLAGRYEEIREMSNSGGQENLSQGLVREIQFAFPQNEAEQRKVTSCLSSLDALITAETQKHAALQRHKRGLMQQLFPSPGESS
ncbi:MAG: restriction endonuclease subunit S [Planctomycetota bacterium]